MSIIDVNGVRTNGQRLEIAEGRVYVGRRDVTPDAKEIHISIIGNIDRLEVDKCSTIFVTGDAGNIATRGPVQISMGGNVSPYKK